MTAKAVNMANIPPPLPPKTRRSVNSNNSGVTAGATVHAVSKPEISFSFPETTSMTLTSPAVATVISGNQHVVKIRINPEEDAPPLVPYKAESMIQQHNGFVESPADGCIRISVSSNEVDQHHEDMVRRMTAASPPDSFIKSSADRNNPYFFYSAFQCPPTAMVISSGQSSPSDTLDSGTCSDLDGSTPPPLPKKKLSTSSTFSGSNSSTVTVTVNGNNHHRRTGSLTSSGAEVDSDDVESNISCDSLNSSELNGAGLTIFEDVSENNSTHQVTQEHDPGVVNTTLIQQLRAVPPTPPPMSTKSMGNGKDHAFPQSLLQDIRDRTAKLTIVPACNTNAKKTKTWGEIGSNKVDEDRENDSKCTTQRSTFVSENNTTQCTTILNEPENITAATAQVCVSPLEDVSNKRSSSIVEERTYEDRKKETEVKELCQTLSRGSSLHYDTDRFYTFHMNENFKDVLETPVTNQDREEDSFAGYKNYLDNRESSSTIRSAKGTVRGVKNRVRAGIATFLQLHTTKSYKEKEAGKVVVYSTTMGVVRETYQECLKVKKILRNLLVKYEERDCFMSREVQAEIKDRMNSDVILVPQVFVEGQYIGDSEAVERLNESGELRRILKPFQSPDACTTCQMCGGHRLLPCTVCNGSKKSVHRNHFTAEFVALKCMHCDEVGLIRCSAC